MTTAYPLSWPDGWPRAQNRKHARFSRGQSHKELSIQDGTERVVAELRALGVRSGSWIISSDLELRNDGLPRSSQRAPADPGVAVYWSRGDDGQKVMAIDLYDRVADNLAAIAATLNAMRAIERHGGAQILERAFTGFTALQAPRSCWDVLGLKPGASRQEIEAAFRILAKRHHPDAPTGDAEKFKELVRAKEEALQWTA